MFKLYAPVDGLAFSLENVPDQAFAQKLVGDGIAIDPTSETLVAPCAGEIVQLHSAHHALTLQNDNGVQVLLHIGLDTVALKGEGFSPKVKVGDHVHLGQPLIAFDADLIGRKAKSLVTLMIVVTGEVPRPTADQKLVNAGRDILLELPQKENAVIKTVTASHETATSEKIKISLPSGLHARPAALIANLAKTFPANVRIDKNGRAANAKSVVGVLGLEIDRDDEVRFLADGENASRAVEALAEFLKNLKEDAEAPSQKSPSPKRRSVDGVLVGVSASPGVVVGRIYRIKTKSFKINESAEGSPDQENARLRDALAGAIRGLKDLSAETARTSGSSQAAIFEAHQELLTDPELMDTAEALIKKGKSAAYAWNEAIQSQARILAGLGNELMANRAVDLRDVGQRVLGGLAEEDTAEEMSVTSVAEPVILVAEDLTPSQTARIDRKKVGGVCTTTGGATSHVAILARSFGLPAVVGMDPTVLEMSNGTEVVLDGERGEMRIAPSMEEKRLIEQRQFEVMKQRQADLEKAHHVAITGDGHRIEVAANIGSVADAKTAIEMGADGVGLLRSEFLFLNRETAPSEDEQWRVYQDVADVLEERPLIIRTLDVGGDKPLKYMPLPHEENPFLGIRGVRVGLKYPEVLRTQLRAILRVKSSAAIHVMFPMIATLEELQACKRIVEEERARLNAKPIKIGIMIEVPSAALIADVLAPELEFFSVGTNDLTQYVLAMDRGHKELSKVADPMHPSVLKLIGMTCQAAKANGKWVGVCGNLASDPKATAILVGLGVEELSVSPPAVPLIKSQVRSITRAQGLGVDDAEVAANRPPGNVITQPTSNRGIN